MPKRPLKIAPKGPTLAQAERSLIQTCIDMTLLVDALATWLEQAHKQHGRAAKLLADWVVLEEQIYDYASLRKVVGAKQGTEQGTRPAKRKGKRL